MTIQKTSFTMKWKSAKRKLKTENEEEEEEPKIEPENIISYILQNFPGLAETEGLNKEQLRERNQMFNMLFESILDQMMHEHEQKKTEKVISKRREQ